MTTTHNAHATNLRDDFDAMESRVNEALDDITKPSQVADHVRQNLAVSVDDKDQLRITDRVALQVTDVVELSLHLIGKALDIQANLLSRCGHDHSPSSVNKSPEPSDIGGVLSGDCFDECAERTP